LEVDVVTEGFVDVMDPADDTQPARDIVDAARMGRQK